MRVVAKQADRILRRTAYCELLADPENAAALGAFVGRYAVVLPQASKFRKSVLERTYYELLRLYANALDRANVLLIAFGFSFRDEHILHITRRALKNPTLRLVIFAHGRQGRDAYAASFADYNNVLVMPMMSAHGISGCRSENSRDTWRPASPMI
jgi:hypothetical protein